jgi:hypothetical protein
LVASPVRRFCSAPNPTAPSLHARGRLPCIRTRVRKRTELAVSPASRVEPASRCSCFDLCMGGGSSSCLAAPWLLRARHAQPSPLFRSFSFRFATLPSHLRLREDRGLPVLGPCLPLPSPRRPPTSITRDLVAPVRIRPQPPYCSSSRTARDLPAHRRPAHRRNIRSTVSCTLDASPSSRTLAFFSTARIGISMNTLTASLIRPLLHHQRSPWRSQGRRHRVPASRAEALLRAVGPCAGARRRTLRPCHIAPAHARTACVLGRVTSCLHRPRAAAVAPLARARQYREPQACSSAATSVLFCSRAATPRALL